jgi:hypothetical protein
MQTGVYGKYGAGSNSMPHIFCKKLKQLIMKKLTFVSIVLLFAISSCKKSSSSGLAANTWTLNGTTYKSIGGGIFTAGANTLTGLDASGNSASVEFNVTPTAGTYTVTADGTDSTDCIVELTTGATSDFWGSTGKAGDKVTVTVSGGKISASFTNITVESTNTPSDSTTTSGSLVQTN